jgi:hypothetical protein
MRSDPRFAPAPNVEIWSMPLIAVANNGRLEASLEKLAKAYRDLAAKAEHRRLVRRISDELCGQSG